jgi:hypothetical protein
MDTLLKKLPPSQAWEEAERRSMAIGVAGLVVVGALRAAGAVPAIYRQALAPASGLVAAFLTALTLSLAYYHNRWSLGVSGAALTLILPYSVNLLWVQFTGRSLMYPVVALVLVGVISLWTAHIPLPTSLGVASFAWLPDSSGMILVGQEQAGFRTQLWYQSYLGGEPLRVTNDLDLYNSVSLSGEGTLVSTHM